MTNALNVPNCQRTLYLRPDKNWALFATVSGVTPDTDHELAYLTDGRPNGFALRVASGTGTIQLSKAAGLVNLVALTHHLLNAGLEITISGDVAGAIEIPPYDAAGIPFHAFVEVDETSVDTLTLAIAGNSTDILIGEAFAGEADELNPSFKLDDFEIGLGRFQNPFGRTLSGIPPYSDRAEDSTISGSLYCTKAELDAIVDWWRSEDAFPYPVPSLLITNHEDQQSLRVVRFAGPPVVREVEVAGPDPYYLVRLNFIEYPRTRW